MNFNSKENFKSKHNGQLGQAAQLPVVKVQCQDHENVSTLRPVEKVVECHVIDLRVDQLNQFIKHVAHGVILMLSLLMERSSMSTVKQNISYLK